jgi:hypothetical protein
MAAVKHVEHPDGSHSIGVEIDGDYLALASASKARVEQNAERIATLRERAESGDQTASDVYEQVTGEAASSKADKADKAGKS